MSEQDRRYVAAMQHPSTEDREAWRAYWQAQGQPWRTQPEIDTERQEELTRCLATKPDIEQGRYPFKDFKLDRADVEWLLSTHESGGMHGPVDWSDESQREREGLDVRGANLRKADLSHLPLACMRGGLTQDEPVGTTPEQRNMAAVHLEGTNLMMTHLEEAHFRRAHLEDANLFKAHLEKADLRGAHLEGADLTGADLAGANVRRAFLNAANNLGGVILSEDTYGCAFLLDVRWGGVNLGEADWATVSRLGDEREARQRTRHNGIPKDKATRLEEYERAARASRQLAMQLRTQGFNEHADRFAYRAQVLQQEVWRRRHRYLKYAGSWLLWLLAGYGYRPFRSLLIYVALILGFALAFYSFGHLQWYEALVVSLTAFHGRGFFSQQYQPGDPQSIIAAAEAVVGLLIEISFIATFTQRFFGK